MLLQPDTDTFLIMAAAGMVMFVISGARWRDIGLARAHFLEPILRRLNRRMRGVVGQVEEERFFSIRPLFEILDRPVAEEIGGVAVGFDLFLVVAHVVDAMTTMRVVCDTIPFHSP